MFVSHMYGPVQARGGRKSVAYFLFFIYAQALCILFCYSFQKEIWALMCMRNWKSMLSFKVLFFWKWEMSFWEPGMGDREEREWVGVTCN